MTLILIKNAPAAIGIDADFGARTDVWQHGIGRADPADAVIHPVRIGDDRDIAEWRRFRSHWAGGTLGPIVKSAAGAVVEPGNGASLNHPPTLKEPRGTHGHQQAQREGFAGCSTKDGDIKVGHAGGHRAVYVNDYQLRKKLRGRKEPLSRREEVRIIKDLVRALHEDFASKGPGLAKPGIYSVRRMRINGVIGSCWQVGGSRAVGRVSIKQRAH